MIPAERLAVKQAREKLARIFQDTPALGQSQKQQFTNRADRWLISRFSNGSGTLDPYGREKMVEGHGALPSRPLTKEQGARFKAEAEAELERLKIEPTVTVPVLRDVATLKESGNPRLWLAEDGGHSQLYDFADETTPDPDAAMEYLAVRIHRCKSKSRGAFIAWGIQQVVKQAGDHFHLKADAIKKFDIGISDLISHALVTGSKYVDFPQHEHDEKAGVYRVNMGTVENPIVWTIPESLWGYALKLWPVHLKGKKDNRYLAKYTGGQEVAAHRLALQPSPVDTVESTTNNLLDWTSLRIRKYNLLHLYEGKRINPQAKFDQNNIVLLAPVRTDDGQELRAIENISVENFYHRKIPMNADLGDAGDYSASHERNDALESGEEQRTQISTTRTINEED